MSYNSLATLATGLFCLGLPFFFVATVVLAVTLFAYRRRSKGVEQMLGEQIASLEHQNELLAKDAQRIARTEWLKMVAENSYRNEVEVEVKFIYPLMKLLGFEDGELQIRVPVEVQVGRQQVAAEADWLVVDSEKGYPLLVIEAKEPGQELNAAVRGQARSYAYGLNVPAYVITNGKRLQVYLRGVVGDQCIVDCTLQDMQNVWPSIEQAIGKPKQPLASQQEA